MVPEGIIILKTGVIKKPDGTVFKTFTNKGRVKIKYRDRQWVVARLVAMVHVPNPKNLPCINHDDGDKANNNDWNLKWCTKKENNQHAFRTGLADNSKASRGKINQEIADEIRIASKKGELVKSLSTRFKLSEVQIIRITTNKRWVK